MAPVAKRRKLDRAEEITFDPEARQEYLTGFSKRKKARIQNARDVAAKREKEERVKERRQIREQRKEDLAAHVAEFNKELRKQNPDLSEEESADEEGDGDEGWEGIAEGKEDGAVEQDEEYVDEDKYTTVTVEAMDLKNDGNNEDGMDAKITQKGAHIDKERTNPRQQQPHRKKDSNKDKPKKRKFRYETKAERQATRQKQKTKSRAAKARRKGD